MVSEEMHRSELPATAIGPRLPVIKLVAGIALPVFYLVIARLISHWSWIRYRPWVAAPFATVLYTSAIAGMLIYAVYVCKKYGLLPLFRFRPAKRLFKDIIYSVPMLFILGVLLWLVSALIEALLEAEIQPPEVWDRLGYAPNSILLLSLLIFGCTVMPAIEEIYFRGFLYNALKTRVRLWIALVVQALVFAGIHRYDIAGSILVFLTGIAFAVAYEKRKNLLTPTLMHCIANAIMLGPLFVLCAMNLHSPAKDWFEAMSAPKWLDISTFERVEHKADGLEQWQYAIDTWGSLGSRQWKHEVKAFEAVCHWFPEDRVACAKARLSIVWIYRRYLRDYRRAVLHADRLLSEYPDQREPCAGGLVEMGWSHYMLKDFVSARKAFDKVITGFGEYDDSISSAQQGIKCLNALEGK